jgi:hypothetical protein
VTTLLLAALLLALTPSSAVRPPLQRPATPTPISGQALRDVMRLAHVDVFGVSPSRQRLALGVAQVAFEGANRSVAFALGGIDAAPGEPFTRWRNCRLRACDSHRECARHYWAFVARRCAGALVAFNAGDPEAAGAAFGRCEYMRLDPVEYGKRLRSLYRP